MSQADAPGEARNYKEIKAAVKWRMEGGHWRAERGERPHPRPFP
jgi:hypothetical protein